MARLPDFARYKGYSIPDVDPLRLYYAPVIGWLYRRRVDVAMALLGRGRRLLEVGHGSGTSFLELSTRFDEIHGLDTHEYSGCIKRIFFLEGIRVHLCQASILDPPYASGSFDAVLAISILEHLRPADQPRVMAAINRLLQPGGVCVVGMPGLNRMMSAVFWMLGYNINEHHHSRPAQALGAAEQYFKIDRIVRQPPLVRDQFLVYTWFRGRKA